MNILSKTLPFLLLSSFVIAEESGYIGAGFSSGTGTQHRNYETGVQESTDYDVGTFELRGGLIDDSNDRFVGSISFISASATKGDFSANTSGYTDSSFYIHLTGSKVWTIGSFEHFAPFVGLGLGINTNTSLDSNATSNESAEGLSGEMSAGLLIAFAGLEIEVSVKSSYGFWTNEGPSITDGMTTYYVGLNFWD
jgi:hypothetical protein